MTLKARILSVLEEGPSPARDVADALGLDYRRVNAYLRDLWKREYVSRRLHHRERARPVWCYSVEARR
ncbi:MAG TPA: helix-turn-helix domain-containing protein [Telluria sp.]|nr:helix-turn-helix domain-containing protein [Telluria sp.]